MEGQFPKFSESADPSEAAKKIRLLKCFRSEGNELLGPGLMSLKMDAPLPVVVHSSTPMPGDPAVKSNVPNTRLVRFWGSESPPPTLMSATSSVELDVPDVLHSSRPCVPSLAVK